MTIWLSLTFIGTGSASYLQIDKESCGSVILVCVLLSICYAHSSRCNARRDGDWSRSLSFSDGNLHFASLPVLQELPSRSQDAEDFGET